MDDQKTRKLSEEILTRRSFLSSLGKWSAVVIASAVVGVREAASAHDNELYEDDDMRPDGEASSPREPDVEKQQCRVWGNKGYPGCRVWGNTGYPGCRVWANRGYPAAA